MQFIFEKMQQTYRKILILGPPHLLLPWEKCRLIWFVLESLLKLHGQNLRVAQLSVDLGLEEPTGPRGMAPCKRIRR